MIAIQLEIPQILYTITSYIVEQLGTICIIYTVDMSCMSWRPYLYIYTCCTFHTAICTVHVLQSLYIIPRAWICIFILLVNLLGEMATKARKYVLRSHFSGLPKREDLEIVEETLPPLNDGGTRSLHYTEQIYAAGSLCCAFALCVRWPCAVIPSFVCVYREHNYVHTHFTCTSNVCSSILDSIPKVNLNLSLPSHFLSHFLPLSLHTEFLCEAQWLSVDPYMR